MLASLKVFDCHAYVTVPKQKLTKFDARVVLCRFLDLEHEKAYQFQEIKGGRVPVSRDAQFMEDVFDGGDVAMQLSSKPAMTIRPDWKKAMKKKNCAESRF
ncbi:unnamed protein product [Peronospora destructor]|uniref:Retroviral polymerase SH3-like domain-containing protein n=1 Tax=Peronospora destructor TaxID=86335 RepID=A0AAV0THC1_9STRA|nr:unnamed protein product [Peronospora destructor]